MVDDRDAAGLLIAEYQVSNADKRIAADVDFKPFLDGQYLILIAKAVKALEVRKPFVPLIAHLDTV